MGFLAATDFHLTAVLFAFPLGLAEGVDKLLKLGDIHHIHLIIGGDIGESVAMGGGLVEGPNIVEVGLALAHITTHEGKGGSLDTDAHTKGAYVGIGAVVGAVVVLAVDAHIGAQIMLASDARVLAVADVVDGVGSHFGVPLSLSSPLYYTRPGILSILFCKKIKKFFVFLL